jgi:hypothetical protein
MPGPGSQSAEDDWKSAALLAAAPESFHLGPGVRRDERGVWGLATERRNLASQMNGDLHEGVVEGASRAHAGLDSTGFRPKGIVLTNRPQAPATNTTNESLTACARFANQINHFSSEIIHH